MDQPNEETYLFSQNSSLSDKFAYIYTGLRYYDIIITAL